LDGLEELRRYITGEFGDADEELRRGSFSPRPLRRDESANYFAWHRKWGSVAVFIEPRDGEPVLTVKWNLS
jgi:hypothetical protein